jgi:hypothetical protein
MTFAEVRLSLPTGVHHSLKDVEHKARVKHAPHSVDLQRLHLSQRVVQLRVRALDGGAQLSGGHQMRALVRLRTLSACFVELCASQHIPSQHTIHIT